MKVEKIKTEKILLYALVGIILLIIFLGSFGVITLGSKKTIGSNIPEECQKPQGQSLEQWKEHLGHHQNTLYCLEYYK